jgi:hypothetical protein
MTFKVAWKETSKFLKRSELIDTLRDPSGAVPGNDLYAGELFRCQLAVKLLQDLLSVPLGCPDDRVRIVVDDDSDVLVPLLVAGLIDAYVYEIIKPAGALRFYVIQRPVHTPSDGLPVNPHILRDNASREINGKPADGKIKVLGKSAVRICPGDIGHNNTMFRALDPMRITGHFNKSTSPIQGSPDTR